MKLIPVAVLFLSLYVGVDVQCKAEDTGFDVGQTMPFHVVDFVAGAKSEGAGCPSVMISNDRSTGIEVWCRTKDENTLNLVKQLDRLPQDNRPRKIFVVLFDGTTRETYTVSQEERTLKSVFVAVPRSKRTGQVFEKAVESAESSVIMFLMNQKVIASRIEFQPNELTPEKIKTVADTANRFLTVEEQK